MPLGEPVTRSSAIQRNPEILGGTPCFAKTRVPIQALFDYLEGGESLQEFLEDFPTVRHEQALAVLKLAEGVLLKAAS